MTHQDEVTDLNRRIEYITKVREVAKPHRTAGFFACLVGAVGLIWTSYQVPGGAFSLPGYLALAVIGLGWGLFAYSLWARTRYVRTHPFDPKA